MAAQKSTAADDLDQEPTEAGKRLVLRFEGEEFTLPDITHGKKWREVTKFISRLGGEQGVIGMESAFDELLGDQIEKTEDWDFAQFSKFANLVGERIGASIGSPGESGGSRR